jgi:hypothetical protein
VRFSSSGGIKPSKSRQMENDLKNHCRPRYYPRYMSLNSFTSLFDSS